MNKQTLGIIGLIGGIMAIGSMALTWGSVSMTVTIPGLPGIGTQTLSASGIDALRAGGESTCVSALVLVGGILALVGGIGTLTQVKVPGYLLPLGGILALVGGIWAFARMAQVAEVGVAAFGVSISASIGYGIYVAIVGAILALVASLGLRGK